MTQTENPVCTHKKQAMIQWTMTRLSKISSFIILTVCKYRGHVKNVVLWTAFDV